MAYITQYQADMDQNARSDRNQAAIGQGLQTFANAFEENRRRAVDAKKAQAAHDYEVKKDNAAMDATKRLTDAKVSESEAKAKYYANKKSGGSGSGENLTYQQKLDMKAQKDAEVKAQERQDPTYKLEKLGAEGRSKVGAIASGIQALDQMDKASADGYEPTRLNANTPVIGGLVSDTPYTEGERMLSEVVGRLQSGGAINDHELKTFRELGPRPGDNSDSRTRKLLQQKDFLKNKLTAFGMSHDDLGKLGFNTTSNYKSKKETSPEDAQAIQWAKQNPNDPRAAQILQLHGVK